MKRRRSIVVVLLGLLLAPALALGIPGVSPEQQASAMCHGSIDPRCAGANLPILIEAGIVSAELYANGNTVDPEPKPVTQTTQAKPKGSRLGGIASLLLNGAALLGGWLGVDWFSGLFANEDGTDELTAPGLLSDNGLVGQNVNTDRAWRNASAVVCKKSPTNVSWAVFTSPVVAGDSSFFSCDISTGGLFPSPQHGQGPNFTLNAGTSNGGTVTIPVTFHSTRSGWPLNLPQSVSMNGSVLCKSQAGIYSSQVSSLQFLATESLQTKDMVLQCQPGQAAVVAGIELANPPSTARSWSVMWSSFGPANDQRMDGTVRVSVQCKTATGTRTVVVDKPISIQAGDSFALPDVVCNDGEVATGVEVGYGPGTETPQPYITSNPVPDEIAEMPTRHPGCLTMAATCALLLMKVVGGELQSCGKIAELCPDWASQPNARELYRCTYGGETLDLDRCSVFRAPDLGPLPSIGQDGEPIPYTAPRPTPTTMPPHIKDPRAPTFLTPPAYPPPSSTPPSNAKNCFPTGWGALNPFEWVMKPVQCALEAAFVPRNSFLNSARSAFNVRLNASQVGKLITVANTSLALPNTTPSGCQGPPLTINPWGAGGTWYPFSACSEPMAGIAATIRALGAALIIGGGFLACLRYIANIVGYAGYGQHNGSHSSSSSKRGFGD